MSIELVQCSDDALLEFLFPCDSDAVQDGAGKLGKRALDEIEPGAVRGRERELELTAGAAQRAKLWSASANSTFSSEPRDLI